ncbi:MAG: hypothetical protein WC284_06310 [Candidimonas sp.]
MDISIFAPMVNERRQNNAVAAIELLEKSVEAGSIPLVRFNEAKDDLNRWVEEVIDHLLNVHRKDFTAHMMAAYEALSCNGITMIGSIRKKVAKAEVNEDIRVALYGWCDRLEPIGELVKKAKTITVKRQPKGDAEPVYQSPVATKAAIELIKTELTEKLTPLMDRWKDNHRQHLTDMANRILSGEPVPSSWFGLLTNIADVKFTRRDRQTYAAGTIVEKKLNNFVEREAQVMLNGFLSKQITKIGSIIDRKFAQGETFLSIACTAKASYVITATVSVVLSGCSFDVITDIRHNISVHGLPFLQFPSRFVNIIQGETLFAAKSEQWMNEEF